MTHVDPDVGGLLVDDVGLDALGQSLQTGRPAGLVFTHWDEERWRQQHDLQTILRSVHQRRPGTDGHRDRQEETSEEET